MRLDVFDLAKHQTLCGCFWMQAWLAEINEYAQDDVVIMLLGNKSDVTNERVVRVEEGDRLAKACDQL